MRKVKFVPGEYYHIYSRTILNSPEFIDNKNANKLSQTFLLANSTSSGEAFDYLRKNRNPILKEAIDIARKGEKLVDVVSYSIMPDHYHLLLRELRENGITDFVRKCNISVCKYINTKNNRRGTLFESRFQSKHVSSNEYLLHLSVYINLNPLDIIDGKEWRKHGLKDWNSKKKILLTYSWSSLKHYLDADYKDLIISGEDIILSQFDSKKEYESFLQDWSEDAMTNCATS